MTRTVALLATLLAALLTPIAAQAADSTTHHTVTLGGKAVPFTAAVETFHLTTPDGSPAADIVTTSFYREGLPDRPVTFAVNGGPGASSAWLDVGAIGPWRVPLATPIVPSQDPAPVDNADTWLPFTDLVFIDPVGTGYSRATGKGDHADRPFLNVDGDIRTLATVVHRWLEAHGRLTARVFIAGESYGGFRGPLLARALLDQQGVGVRGLVLISPVLDFNGRDAPYDPLRWAARLPSLVALARGATDRAAVSDAEAYASGPFIVDLLRGPGDKAAVDRIVSHVSDLTGLDPALVRRREGRIDLESVLRDRVPGRVASPYDATVAAQDPFPAAPHDNSPDPILDGLRAPITEGMLSIYRNRLDWKPDGAPARHYELLSDSIARQWDYGHSNHRPEAMTALRQYLALDPTTRVLIVHGLTDLVTPYFETALLLRQVPPTEPPGRLSLEVLPGGHMSYLRDASRADLMRDAAAMMRAALSAGPTAAGTPTPAPPPGPGSGTPSASPSD